MKFKIVKYDLWVALQMCPDQYKTEDVKKLEKELNDNMDEGYTVEVKDGL
jgi:hypothetical protein